MKYALQNFTKGRMISKSLWNEILLYLSLQRQVNRAFEIVGVRNFYGNVLKIYFSDGHAKNPIIDVSEEKKRFWNVGTPEELLERMALFHMDNF